MVNVERVVLDSNYFRNLTEPELAAVKARRLAISLSVFVIGEVWANASKNQKPGILYGPLKRVSPYLDQAYPVVMGGGHLRAELETLSVSERQRRAFENRATGRAILDALLKDMAVGAFDHDGAVLNNEIDEHGRSWTETRLRVQSKEFPGLAELSKEQAVIGLRTYFEQEIPMPQRHRFDAYFATAASVGVDHAMKLPRRKPHDNDVEDLGLVALVALPTLVVTWDLGLVAEVDRSATYQAPWVKTLGELLTDPLPRGLPWGESAVRQSKAFLRRSTDSLRQLEERVRGNLRRRPDSV